MKEFEDIALIRAGYRRARGERVEETLLPPEDIPFVGAAFLRLADFIVDQVCLRYGGRVPAGCLDGALAMKTTALFGVVGGHIEDGALAQALDCLNMQVAEAFDWLHSQPEGGASALYNGVQLLVNLALLYEPFLPRTVRRLRGQFGFGRAWQFSSIPAGTQIAATSGAAT